MKVLEKKIVDNSDNKSMLNCIIGYHILLCPKSKENDLKHMAENGSMPLEAIV